MKDVTFINLKKEKAAFIFFYKKRKM